jgi:hypothetical protein
VPVFSGPIMQNSECAIEIINKQVVRNIRDVVRLYALDESLLPWIEWHNVPRAILELVGTMGDRELQPLLPGGRVLSSIQNRGSINAAIKSGSQLVENLTDLEREISGESDVSWLQPHSPVPVVINMQNNIVSISVSKAVPSLCKSVSVSLCPFDALPTTFKWSQWIHRDERITGDILKNMKPLPAPDIPGKTESERFDNALRRVFSVSKDDLRKREEREKRKKERKKKTQHAAALRQEFCTSRIGRQGQQKHKRPGPLGF